MNRKTKLILAALVLLVAAFTTYSAMFGSITNPLAELDANRVASMGFFPPAAAPRPIMIPLIDYEDILDTFNSPTVEHNPMKWQTAGRLVVNLVDGDEITLDLYDTNSDAGVFRIGDTYFRHNRKYEMPSVNIDGAR